MWDFPLFPERASALAGRIDALYFAVVAFAAFFSAVICVLVVAFAVRYRRGSPADRSNPITHHAKMETIWAVVPTAIALALFFWAAFVFFDAYNAPPDAAEIYVVGKQWMWYLRHPEGRREINELHVPLNRPVKLTMTSQDVIHSFYVPAFRVKQDVLPSRPVSLWFQPTKLGRYHLFCAEYCGTKHSGMVGWIHVMEPSEYEQWLQTGAVGESMAASGAKLFRQYGCSGCHSANSTVRAPLLEGVYGGPVPLQSGQVVTADDRYIRDSIRMPKAEVVAGFEPVMPVFQPDQLSEEDLLQIVAYIKSLSKEGRAAQ